MNDREKKAIERMKDITNYINENSKYENYEGYYIRCRSEEAKMFETVLNLIENQNHIIEGKEALIDTMTHNEEVLNKIIDEKQAEIEEKDKSLKLHTKLEYQYKNDYLNVIEELKKKDKIIYEIAKSNVKLKGYDIEETYINNTISFYTKYIENLERNPHWRKE